MKLFSRQSGTGDPLIILHGLYGSSDNWYSIGRALSAKYQVFMIDMRNHGNSPHHPEHNYRVICDDLDKFIKMHDLHRPVFIGHSMGGKAALAFGLNNPEKVGKMIVVDISPFGYTSPASELVNSHRQIIRGLLEIHPESIGSRGEADTILKKFISSSMVRQFLLKNLKRDPQGKFYWGLNLPVLADNMPGIFASVIDEKAAREFPAPPFPLLFIKGEFSDYISEKDEDEIKRQLPWSQIITIPNAGHWVHSEQPEAFLAFVRNFIG